LKQSFPGQSRGGTVAGVRPEAEGPQPEAQMAEGQGQKPKQRWDSWFPHDQLGV